MGFGCEKGWRIHITSLVPLAVDIADSRLTVYFAFLPGYTVCHGFKKAAMDIRGHGPSFDTTDY